MQQPVIVQNTFGEMELNRDDTSDWSTFATVWASIMPISSRSEEKFGQDNSQLLAEVDHTINMRHCDGLTHKMRIKYGSRLFDINAVLDPDGRQREMILMCKEQPSG